MEVIGGIKAGLSSGVGGVEVGTVWGLVRLNRIQIRGW